MQNYDAAASGATASATSDQQAEYQATQTCQANPSVYQAEKQLATTVSEYFSSVSASAPIEVLHQMLHCWTTQPGRNFTEGVDRENLSILLQLVQFLSKVREDSYDLQIANLYQSTQANAFTPSTSNE